MGERRWCHLFDVIIGGLKADDPKTIRWMKALLWISIVFVILNIFVLSFFVSQAVFIFLGWV
jgi:hypothetical protein